MKRREELTKGQYLSKITGRKVSEKMCVMVSPYERGGSGGWIRIGPLGGRDSRVRRSRERGSDGRCNGEEPGDHRSLLIQPRKGRRSGARSCRAGPSRSVKSCYVLVSRPHGE